MMTAWDDTEKAKEYARDIRMCGRREIPNEMVIAVEIELKSEGIAWISETIGRFTFIEVVI